MILIVENVSLLLEIFKEGKWFIARCPALDLTAQGKTPSAAEKSFKISWELILADMVERKTLDRYLIKLGWEKRKPDAVRRKP